MPVLQGNRGRRRLLPAAAAVAVLGAGGAGAAYASSQGPGPLPSGPATSELQGRL